MHEQLVLVGTLLVIKIPPATVAQRGTPRSSRIVEHFANRAQKSPYFIGAKCVTWTIYA